jgi:hypothetical protein
MATKTITNTYISTGYVLSASYSTLDITSTGTIGGTGVVSSHLATIDNQGTAEAAGEVAGISLTAGGTVINGANSNTNALILGERGVIIRGGVGTVSNFASINGEEGSGVYLGDSGIVTNGSSADKTARISGGEGIEATGDPVSVTNFGTIYGSAGAAVYLSYGGEVINGSGGDPGALLLGATGISADKSATVNNFGSIAGDEAGEFAVALYDGGEIINGSSSDTTVRISGGGGVEIEGAAGSIVNFATLEGASQSGVVLLSAGAVTNGSSTDTKAFISGFDGVQADAAATVTNSGTIEGLGAPGFGVLLTDGGLLTNGSKTDTSATVSGYVGVYVGAAAATVVNFGFIGGTNGVALEFNSSSDVLKIEGGGGFSGDVLGDEGSLVLDAAGGAGTLYSLGFYMDFAAITVAANASWTFTGDTTITSDSTLTVNGTLTSEATLTPESAVYIEGKGVFINGSASDTTALVFGSVANLATAGKVQNYGSIFAPVAVVSYGTVTNGGSTDTAAYIDGGLGVVLTNGGKLTNFGTIVGATAACEVYDGSSVVNGSASDTTALITSSSKYAVEMGAGPGGVSSVTNFGTISDTSTYAVIGAVVATSTVSVINGSTTDTGAEIKGVGFRFAGAANVTNFATLTFASDGYVMSIAGAGTIVNGAASDAQALITGGYGIRISGAGALTNFGSIKIGGEIEIVGSSVVTNGSASDKSAAIDLYEGVKLFAGGTVTNFGSIVSASFGPGVEFEGYPTIADPGGLITNGSASDRTALISGRYGIDAYSVRLGPVTVVNYGTIAGSGDDPLGVGVYFAGASDLLVIESGSTITGRAFGAGGTLEFGAGGGAGTFADIGSNSNYSRFGAYVVQAGGDWTLTGTNRTDHLTDNGTLINAGTIDAELNMAHAVFTNSAGANLTGAGVAIYGARGGADTVTNLGTISAGAFAPDVALAAGGSVANGSATDLTAGIGGSGAGVEITGGAGTVTNFGTIAGALAGWEVVLSAGGAVINGGATDTGAVIDGVIIQGGVGTVTNFGTLAGGAVAGADLTDGGSIVNGASNDAKVVISGAQGVELTGAGTLTNFGTVIGTGGVAVQLAASTDTLIVEGGSDFVGAVDGADGKLDLASGTGAVTFVSSGVVGVSGSMTPTTFNDFGPIVIGAAGHFTQAGDSAAPSSLTVEGTLTTGGTLSIGGSASVSGVLAVTGSLSTTGTVSGAGTLSLAGGTTTIDAGTRLTIAKISEAGGSTLAMISDSALAYAGVWTQTGGTLSVSLGDRATLMGSGSSFSGTLAGAGTVAFMAGSDTLAGATLTADRIVISSATVTLSGAISDDDAIAVTTPNIIVAAAGASLSGRGPIELSDTATNKIMGASASATLTNVANTIEGAGLLGGGEMILVNDAGGVIDGNQAEALTIDTGAKTITNAGLIEDTGAGGTTIASAVNNSGTLSAAGGALTLLGPVTGAGMVRITAGVADFVSAFSENVVFAGTTGVLELGLSQAYGGSITGFSKTGSTSLDLADIDFIGGTTKAGFSGTTASGVLTVTDGTHTARITLIGNYTASMFSVSKDSHGGTIVVDPTPAKSTVAAACALVTAAAAFAPASPAQSGVTPDARAAGPPLLASPSSTI